MTVIFITQYNVSKLPSVPALCAGSGKFHKGYSYVFAAKAKPKKRKLRSCIKDQVKIPELSEHQIHYGIIMLSISRKIKCLVNCS